MQFFLHQEVHILKRKSFLAFITICLYFSWLTTNWIEKNVCHKKSLSNGQKTMSHIVWILLKMSHFWHFPPIIVLLKVSTLFENYSKCRTWVFEFWHFSPSFVLLNVTWLVTLCDRCFRFSKSRQNGPFLAFLINFCPLKM